MILMPAIDLYAGKLVRMVKGRPDQVTFYSDNPVKAALELVSLGASCLHVVDLDAALSTGSDNSATIRRMISEGIPVQAAGGIRSVEKARELLSAGAKRVVFGTAFFEEPSVPARIVSEYGTESVVAALDYRSGLVVSKGWRSLAGPTLGDALRLAAQRVSWVLLTDTERDGTLLGPDLCTLTWARQSVPSMRIMAAGGVRGIHDIRLLSIAGVDCAIIGRATYEKRIDLGSAMGEFRGH